jgi:hypothetical protein
MKITLLFAIFFVLISCSDQEKLNHSVPSEKNVKKEGIPDLQKEMSFYGEKILLKDEDIRERLDKELLVNVYFQSATVQAMKSANRYFQQIEKILKKLNPWFLSNKLTVRGRPF